MSFILTNYLEQVIATVSKSTWPTSHSSRIVLLMGISSLLKFTYKAASEKFQRTMENFLSELRRRALFSVFFGWIFGTNVAYDAEVTPWEAPARLSDYINNLLGKQVFNLTSLALGHRNGLEIMHAKKSFLEVCGRRKISFRTLLLETSS